MKNPFDRVEHIKPDESPSLEPEANRPKRDWFVDLLLAAPEASGCGCLFFVVSTILLLLGAIAWLADLSS